MSDATLSPAAMADTMPEQLTTADGKPLKQALIRAQSHARRRAFLLVAPLLAFILLTFVMPIGQMLHRSVHNEGFTWHEDVASGERTRIMANLSQWFDQNELGTEPGEAAFAALAADLVVLREVKAAGQAGTRINYERSGSRSMFTKAARRAQRLEAPFKEAIVDLDEDWLDPDLWRVMRDASSSYTANFYLAALDRTKDADGNVTPVNENRQVYVKLFQRTLFLSIVITFMTFILAYPIAHLLATLPLAKSNLLMILVLLPFWTSLLVRTTSWMVLLQSQGVVNDALVSTGILADDNRLEMMYNQAGTLIAMTHILLPFMVLPLYSVMRPINPSYVRAARSLGATSWTAFRRVYFPQTVPGIGAGALLVFILAVGYYITPALVGGADGQLISNLIAFHMQNSLNWSLAAALAALLLGGILLLYWLYDRLVGIDNLKLG
ncbi:ABC transporter permease [Epibacterium ulvae]|uniref:ABC transporter permease n=1 Tax=Epibacterium ulvae TaxID=1156985 RepID=UPI001BFCA701|nr:ABC transporter permease [Epibacterium ulvae]MBT8153213.1 ABC transporter permease [Epibacterium ulvae]